MLPPLLCIREALLLALLGASEALAAAAASDAGRLTAAEETHDESAAKTRCGAAKLGLGNALLLDETDTGCSCCGTANVAVLGG